MKIIIVNKPDGTTYTCLLMRHKFKKTWSFINLTKQHICPCKFNTDQEAIQDLEQQVKDGKVASWHYIDETSIKLSNNHVESDTNLIIESQNLIKCPKCGESYYQEMYSVTTALYCPPIMKDGVNINPNSNKSTTHCHCCNCGNEFDI